MSVNKFVESFNSDVTVSKWLTLGNSVVGHLPEYFAKNPSNADVKNHLSLITTIMYNSDPVTLTKLQIRVLTNTLLEYATNEVYTYRGEPVYRAFEAAA